MNSIAPSHHWLVWGPASANGTVAAAASRKLAIVPARAPKRSTSVPFDLARHDLLMNLEPLRSKRIRSIVDELCLPLLQSGQGTAT
jgi:hypothetical protein